MYINIPRVIPVLLLQNQMFVKTTRYKNPIYIGDPINTINLFNQFEVDEIVVLDIKAQELGINFSLIEELSSECWTPLTYGGGIKSLSEIQKILEIGVEKVVLGKSAYLNPTLIKEASNIFGSQAIVVSLDIKKNFWGKYVCIPGNKGKTLIEKVVDIAKRIESLGAGEILLNDISSEGTMKGYDIYLIRLIAESVSIPVIANGGCSKYEDLLNPIKVGKASATAGSSVFLYRNANKGVLINFPSRVFLETYFKEEIINDTDM